MTSNENLFVVASEECGELQQEISKVLRFGANHCYPEGSAENQYKLLTEFYQLEAIIDKLVEIGCIYPITSEEIKTIKSKKLENVEMWAAISRNMGRIKEEI